MRMSAEYEYIEDSVIYGVIAVLVAIAFIFIGVCILVFCLSRSKTKKYLEQPDQENYRKASSFYAASIVFTVFITLFTLGGIAGFFTCLIEIWSEQDAGRLVWDIVEIVEFLLSATAFTLGITALVSFGKARNLYLSLQPPRVPVYGGQYPGQYPTQGYPQPYSPQQQYPQQGYQQPSNTPQQYSQPANTQQQYSQPESTRQYPQPSYQQSTYAPPAPAEKMCPHCGVVNEGKNQFCVFCGKPI